MSTTTNFARTHWRPLFGDAARWFGRRFVIYVAVAAGSMGLFAAGAAFYTFVWPAVPIAAQPSKPQLPIRAPAPTVPLPSLTPITHPLPGGAPSDADLVASAGNPIVVQVLPPKWNVVGTPIADYQNSPLGKVIGIEIDPQANKEEIIIQLRRPADDGNMYLTVPTRFVAWESAGGASEPTKGIVPFPTPEVIGYASFPGTIRYEIGKFFGYGGPTSGNAPSPAPYLNPGPHQ
jgi:hypothetical protein